MKSHVTILSFALLAFAQPVVAVITDTPENLIVPAGETYALSGTHAYSQSVEIAGSLNVIAYDGTTNTGWLSLSAASMTVAAGGRISATSSGYRSGEGPGAGLPPNGWAPSGAGHGGFGGSGGSIYDDTKVNGGGSYGDPINPVAMGSGGGGAGQYKGSSGGGSIQLTSNGSIIIDGSVEANSVIAPIYAAGGSGGSIIIHASRLTGTGTITANGGPGGGAQCGGGAGGRIALFYAACDFTGSITAHGAAGDHGRDYTFSGAGTIYKKSTVQTAGDIFVANALHPHVGTPLSGRYASVTVSGPAIVTSSAALSSDTLTISGPASFTQTGNQLRLTTLSITDNGALILDASAQAICTNATIEENGTLTNNGSCDLPGSVVLTSSSAIRNVGSSLSIGNINLADSSIFLSSAPCTVNDLSTSGRAVIYNHASLSVLNNLNLSNGATFYQRGPHCDIHGMATIGPDALFVADMPVSAGAVIIREEGTMTHAPVNTGCRLMVSGDMTIETGGRIDVNGRGYRGGDGILLSNGEGPGGGGSASNGGGGGYGGTGGTGRWRSWDPVGLGGSPYGSMLLPSHLGSGGGVGGGRAIGGAGGGTVDLVVNGTLQHNGLISANGLSGGHSNTLGNGGGGGSGGTINITAGTLTGTGLISVNGGNGDIYSSAGGGSGGRIALYYKNSTYMGQVLAQPGTGGIPAPQAGTIMTPEYGGTQQHISVTNTPLTHSVQTSLSESVRTQYANGTLSADGTLRGTIIISSLTITTIQTGGFSNRGFAKGKWTAVLESVPYQGDMYCMVYLKPDERKLYLHGVMEGVVDGAIDGCITESMPGSNSYDQCNAAWTFRLGQSGSVLTCGTMQVSGALNYLSEETYANLTLKYGQSATNAALSGGYTGDLNTVLTTVHIDDTRHPDTGEGFCSLSYQWNALTGKAGGFVKTVSPEQTDLKIAFEKPLLGTAAGLLQDTGSEKSLWLVLTRLDIGQEPQPDLSVNLLGNNRMSPGQLVTYTVEVRNNGARAARNMKIILLLPLSVRFLSASGAYYYHNGCEWDIVSYDNPEKAPETVSWQLPEIPNQSVQTFSVLARLNWGNPTITSISADVGLYEYEPE